jgi:hypothetical protein
MSVVYLENSRGFLALKNSMLMQLESVSLTQTISTDEIATFDQSFTKTYQPSWIGYSFDATGIVDTTTTGYASYTGGTAGGTLTGSTNGELIFELAKSRSIVTLVLKHDNNAIERGNCIIQSADLKMQAGKFQTFSVKGVICGALTKSST